MAGQLNPVAFEAMAQDDEPVPVIVLLNHSGDNKSTTAEKKGQWLNLQDHIEQVQQQLADDMGWVNFNDMVKFKHVPAIAKTVTAQEFKQLAASDLVQGVYTDRLNNLSLNTSSKTVGLNALADTVRLGQGYAVAIIDSGVQASHPFLASRVIAGACFSFNASCPGGTKRASGIEAGMPCSGPGCFHGTHVAGIVAGQHEQLSGIAKDASLIAINVFSTLGQGITSRDSDVMQALDWVYQHADSYHIAAVNMSLGGGYYSQPCDDSPIKRYVDLLATRGVVTVIAAGNEGREDGVASPGCISTAVTVGSIEPEGTISAFSNSYAQLDMVAPGGHITSSVLNGEYAASSGTSMAAPHVAGAIALLKSTYPKASVEQLMAALQHGHAFTDPRNNVQTPGLYLPTALAYLQQVMSSVPPPKNSPVPDNTPQTPCRQVIDGIVIENTDAACQPQEGAIQW
ncbi:S8 family peptidase [Alteromonas sp. 14N.309.X.WAT.G.H12]|uniref:S8 family peptidase n=1 Tax=Alteromonas sp. 14N.309.X.WAT.G.H12 TaxID=3120824 RepID=UPI002FD1373C